MRQERCFCNICGRLLADNGGDEGGWGYTVLVNRDKTLSISFSPTLYMEDSDIHLCIPCINGISDCRAELTPETIEKFR